MLMLKHQYGIYGYKFLDISHVYLDRGGSKAEGFFYCYLFHFLDDGQDHRAALGAVEEVFSEGVSHLGLDGVPFGDVAGFAAVKDGLDAFSGFGQEGFAVSHVDEAAGDDVGAG